MKEPTLTTMNDAAKALKKANADLDVDKVTGDKVVVRRIAYIIFRCMT